MAAQDRVATERKRRRPTRSGVVLSEEMIIERAVRLVDEHGADALTVRRLGAALGADPSAIYRYFRGTEDLLLALADRMIGEALDDFEADDDWRTALRELAFRVYRSALRHPRVATLTGFRVTRRPNELRAVENGIGILRGAGFDEESAVRHYHVFIDTVLGHAALDAAVANLPEDQRAGDERAWRETYAEAPADRYPHLRAARDHLPVMAGSAFEATLDLLLAAFSARLPGAGAR
ncbi:TetR/AcrR family transcriptional regulator [Streptomyces sp. NPDC002004]